MAGSISSIGIGSGLQLQDILDQLRDVDNKAVITPKESRISDYEAQLEEFTVVENKLYSMKSAVLDLSLASTFLGRSSTSSAEDVLTADVVEGASPQNTTLTVDSLAQKSSWMSSTGASSQDTIVYVPTSVQSATGVTNPDDPAEAVVSGNGTLDITFGGSTGISVNVGPSAGVTTMNELVDAINTAGAGSVEASTFVDDGLTYLRIETATPDGTGEENRVEITGNDTKLTLEAPSKTLAYTLGETTASVDVTADTTLSELVNLINDATDNPGVTASIIDDGGADPYRLVLKADGTGEDNRIAILSQMPDMTMSEQAGKDSESLNARFSIDGIAYQRQQNSFNDVLSGVTINLQGAGEATVSVTNNDSAIKDMVTELVSAYNDAIQEIQAKATYDQDAGKFGVLARTSLRDLPFELQKIMTATISTDTSGNIHSMFDLGLQFERDGTISIDEDVLSSAVTNDASGVQSLFLGDEEAGVTGLADSLNERLRTLLASDGQVKAESDAAQSSIDDLNQQIETETARLDKKYELMTNQFIALDNYMNQMTSVSNYLSSQFDSLASGWVTSKSTQ